MIARITHGLGHPHLTARARLDRWTARMSPQVRRLGAGLRRVAAMPIRSQHILWIVLAVLLVAFVVVLVAVPTGVGRGGR